MTMTFGSDVGEIEYQNGAREKVVGLQVGLFLVHQRAENDRNQRDLKRGGDRPARAWKITHLPSGRAVDFSRLETALRIADTMMLRYVVSEVDTDRPLPPDGMAWLKRCVIADRMLRVRSDES